MILTTLDSITFTSEISDLAFQLEDETEGHLDLRIIAGGRTLLDERYYTTSQFVTVHNVRALIEQYLRDKSLTFTTVYLDDGLNQYAFNVVYCDRQTRGLGAVSYLRSHFLTTATAKRIAPTGRDRLTFVGTANESSAYSLLLTFTVGNATETLVMEKTYNAGATLSSTRLVAIDISIPTCRALLTAQYGADVTLRSVTVRASERSLTYFVEPQAPTDTFAFRNVFNVMEPVPLLCITTEKTDVSRSLAVCNSTASFYDQSTAVTYEVETAPLTREEAHWLGQMLSSYEVRHSPSAADYADALDTLPRVLITDMTAEVQNGDSELNTLKFTYRYEDERPLLIFSDNSDIFTDQFTDPYA